MLRKNADLSALQLSGCVHAVDDTNVRLMSNLANLNFLDLSYCKNVTDAGLIHFQDKEVALNVLVMNGMVKVTHIGLSAIITSCAKSIIDLEVAFLDQEELKPDFFAKIGICWQL